MSTTKKDKNQQVRVFVRVRPLNKREAGKNVISIRAGKELYITHNNSDKKYTFDKVFGPDSKQVELYKFAIQQTILEVISGYNCTVLAYGQTGTGKTYTMAGSSMQNFDTSSWFEDEQSGIIPRSLSHMFDELRFQQLEHTVRVSYLELYNEEIFDLLSPVEDTTKLKLFDDSFKKGSVIVQGLQEMTVHSKNDVYKVLAKGAEKRRIAATLMNAQSSRSHTVFCVTIHIKENSIDGEDLLKTGKLYLVDLAGSENIKQSGATDIRAREAFSINQSLLTLGRCICKLNERSAHIPYRESKLTRLLQDSLGGRTKTTLIATVSPSSCNTDESINTIEYAMRAKSIMNKPEINQRMSKHTLIKEYTVEIERLRKDLTASRGGSGITLDTENYDMLMRELSIQKEEIANKIGMIRLLQTQMEDKEQLCEELKISLEKQQQEVQIKGSTIISLESQLDEVSEEMSKVKEENKFGQFVAQKYSETAQQLKSTATELLAVADISTLDVQKLHKKIDVLTDLEQHNKQVCVQQGSTIVSTVNLINDKIDILSAHNYSYSEGLQQTANTINHEAQQYTAILEDVLDNLDSERTQIENFRTLTTSDLTSCKNTIMQNVAIAKRECGNQFTKILIPIIRDLLDCFVSRHTLVDKYIMESKSMIMNSHREVAEFVNFCKIHVGENKHEQELQAQQESEKYNHIYDFILKEYESKALCKTTLGNVLAEVEASEERMTKWKEELLSMQTNLDDRQENNVIHMNKTIDRIDKFNALIEKKNRENINTIQSTEDEKTALDNTIKKTEKTFDRSVKNCEEIHETNFNNLNQVCLTEMNKLTNSIVDRLSEQQTSIDEFNKTLRDAVNSVVGCLSQMSSKAANMQDNIKENKAFVCKLTSDVSTALDSWREERIKLSKNLKEYKVTGETPQRKSYHYSRFLQDTVPHDQLKEEFQKTRSLSASHLMDKSGDEKENKLDRTISSSETNIPKLIVRRKKRTLTEDNQ